MPTLDINKPVPIGLDTLPFDGSPDAPPKEVEPTDDIVVAPPIDPVEAAQPEEMRFTQDEYDDFGKAFYGYGWAKIGGAHDPNNVYELSDFFRLDPESSEESPMYLYTGTPINAYGGYGEDPQGRSVKITRGNSVFTGGSRKGQKIGKDFVVKQFIRDLKAIDESP